MADSLAVSHVTTAALAVGFINWLKSNKSPLTGWITNDRPKVARYLAFVTAAIGTIGIHYAWDPSARALTFHIPTLAVMLATAIAYVKSFVFQELTYQATKRPNIADLVSAVTSALRGGPNPGPNLVPGGQK